MREHNESPHPYVFERSEEATRPSQQGRFLVPLTRRLLEDAGDVTLLLAELVGPGGHIVGVVSNAAVLETARQRVREAGWSTVSLVSGDIGTVA